MSNVKLSICFPSIRPHLWKDVYDSLASNTIEWEIIAVGPEGGTILGPRMKFIQSNVKPSQCYEIAFRSAQGELLHWSTDDCTYGEKAIDNAYQCYKSQNNEKVVVAMRPIEDGTEITWHTLKGGNTPPMAPFGVMSTKLFHELGGYDRRFICGQSENDVVMRVLEVGGYVITSQGSIVYAHHMKGHRGLSVFRGGVDHKRGFYGEDRKVLEPLWINKEGMTKLTGIKAEDDKVDWGKYLVPVKRRDVVDRFIGTVEELCRETQGPKGIWE